MNKILALTFLMLFSACSQKSPVPESTLNSPAKPKPQSRTEMMIDPLTAQIQESSVLVESTFDLGEIPHDVVAKTQILVFNSTSVDQSLSLNLSQLSAVTPQHNCPATLAAKRSCVIDLFLDSRPLNVNALVSESLSINNSPVVISALIGPALTSPDQITLLNDEQLEFGSVEQNDILQKKVKLFNPSSEDQSLQISTDNLTNASVDSSSNCGSTLKAKRVCILYFNLNTATAPAQSLSESFSVQGSSYNITATVVPESDKILDIQPSLTSVELGTFSQPGLKTFSISFLNLESENFSNFEADTTAPVEIQSTNCNFLISAKRSCLVTFKTKNDGNWASGVRAETLRIKSGVRKSSPITVNLTVTPPSLSASSFKLNNDVAYTKELSVVASIDASALEMKVSSNLTCEGGTWEPYVSSKNLILNSNQLSNYSLQVRNGNNNNSNCITKSITHDNIAPVITYTQNSDLILNRTEASVAHTWNYTFTEVNPSSQYSFEVYDNAACSGTPLVNENGVYTPSTSTSTLVPKRSFRAIKVLVTDLAGNAASACSKSVTYGHPSQVSVPLFASSFKVYETPYSFTGTVKDIYNNVLEGITLNISSSLNNITATSNSSGGFTFTASSNPSSSSSVKVKAPSSTITVSPEGYSSVTASGSVQVLRRSCQEYALYDLISSSSSYTVDADLDGAGTESTVTCDFTSGVDTEVAPFTTITNREKVSRSLKSVLGIERIIIPGLTTATGELGPSGQAVYKLTNNDPRVRLVGSGTYYNAGGTGSNAEYRIDVNNNSSYLEVTFYGTGINLLYANNAAYDIRYVVNGGSESINLVPATPSAILDGRNYPMNRILPIVSGLNLGLHTVRIRNASTTNNLRVYGVEILNERTNVLTYQGGEFSGGQLSGITAPQSSAYNQGINGIFGGRVIKYVKDNQLLNAATSISDAGTELNSNGSFDLDISDWSIHPLSTSSASWSSGSLVSATATGYFAYQKDISGLETGKVYLVTADVSKVGLRPAGLRLYNTAGTLLQNAENWDLGSTFSNYKSRIIFTASASTMRLALAMDRNATNQFVSFDNVSVRKINVLADADHSNEEVAKTYNFRNFGSNRGDDFSTLAGTDSQRAYTLNDNLTTLNALNVRANNDFSGETIHVAPASGNFIALTFIGTGLDITHRSDSLVKTMTVWIDGVQVGTATGEYQSQTYANPAVMKIVSGLPYGTHTVRFNFASGSRSFGIADFIIYQPKKPTLPSGSKIVADYNVLADFIHAGQTASVYDILPQGVIRKTNSREFTYVNGTGGTADFNIAITVGGVNGSGFQVYSNRQNAYCELPFFGTGFAYKYYAATTTATNLTVTLNGLPLTAANFPTAQVSIAGVGTYNSSTGVFNLSAASTTHGNWLTVRGLPLGSYKMRMTNSVISTNTQIHVTDIDVITPVHSYQTSTNP